MVIILKSTVTMSPLFWGQSWFYALSGQQREVCLIACTALPRIPVFRFLLWYFHLRLILIHHAHT